MKTRSGFISNSSSSCFILFLDKRPKSASEVRELLFPGEPFFANEHFWADKENAVRGWLTSEVAEFIFERIKDKQPINEVEIKQLLAHREACKVGSKLLGELCNGKYVIAVEFADDDSALEASLTFGRAFRKVNHIEVSLH